MRTIAVLGMLLSLAGCSKSAPTLTKPLLEAANKDLDGKAWNTSFTELKTRLGAPRVEDTVNEGTEYTWAVTAGDSCYQLTASNKDGNADLTLWDSTAAKQPGYKNCLEDAKKYQ